MKRIGYRIIFWNEIHSKKITVMSTFCTSLLADTGVPRESHRPAVSHWQTLSHNVVLPEWDSNSQL
jgi:hypothetical protein